MGGNRIAHEGDTATPTASISTIKMHWNSVLSTPNAHYITLDVKDFYLSSKLNEHEHMFIELALIPDDFIKMHNLEKKQ